MTKFIPDDGIQHSPSLPTPVARVRWFHGDPRMLPVKEADPVAYYGGFAAFVKGPDGQDNPPLPWKIYERNLPKGKSPMYCSRVAAIVPIAGRVRYETIGPDGSVVSFGPQHKKGEPSKPHLQIYAMIVGFEKGEPVWESPYYAIVEIVGWSAFISYQNARKKWNDIEMSMGSRGSAEFLAPTLLRFYGTVGEPKFRDTGKGRFVTDIMAVNTEKHILIPESTLELLAELQLKSILWKEDSVWRGRTISTPFDAPEPGFDINMSDTEEIPY